MFALTHSDLDDKTIQLLQARQAAVAASGADAKLSKVQEAAVAAADASVHSEVPSGPSLELADKVDHAETTGKGFQEPVSSEVSGNHAGRNCFIGFGIVGSSHRLSQFLLSRQGTMLSMGWSSRQSLIGVGLPFLFFLGVISHTS